MWRNEYLIEILVDAGCPEDSLPIPLYAVDTGEFTVPGTAYCMKMGVAQIDIAQVIYLIVQRSTLIEYDVLI